MSGLDLLFLCAGWPPDVGGVESHVQDLARQLMARGHRVRALCLSYAEEREPFSLHTEAVEGVEVTRLAYRYQDHDALAVLVKNPRCEAALLEFLTRTPADVVHVHHLTGFGLGLLELLDALGRVVVMTLHDYWSLCPRGQMLDFEGEVCARPEPERCALCLGATWPHLMPSGSGRAEDARGEPLVDDAAAALARTDYALASLRLPAALLTPSEAARRVYAAAGLDPARVEVCPNGVEVGDLAELTAQLRETRKPGLVRLGVLGTVLPSKGVLELARVCAEVHLPQLHLEVHGNLPSYHGDDSYVRALQDLARDHERIHVHGAFTRQQLPRILSRLDGVAAPSRWEEVFGLTVREARAAGLAVLVSDAGDLPAVTDGGRAGLVVPRDDREAWSAALARFVEEPGARAEWAAAVSRPRTSLEMARQIEGVYLRVTGGALSRRGGVRGVIARLFGLGEAE